ncbi:MAG: FAD-binding oxidoreductase [Actinomycetota bacterium]|nr:FAD-binding oxidoreductase [Actinomycetota bacterium]
MAVTDFRTNDYRGLSLWFDQLGSRVEPRPALVSPIAVDVAIVGAGFTGLWTAYYLLGLDPSLRIAVLDAETAGFGASGRNGGWCSALYPVSIATLAREVGRSRAVAQYRAMHESVTELERVLAAESIDADLAMGGTIVVARTSPQWDRARNEVRVDRSFGLDLQLLDAEAAAERLRATDVLGATYTPHCACVQPAKLVRGLADVIERRGARIYEHTRATSIEPGAVHTAGGTVRAERIVRATEGFTAQLPRLRREIAPVYSLVIATEPLPVKVWERIGLAQRETFSDHRHLIIYGQRSADDRMVFGGRGAPYHFGSRIRPAYDRVSGVFDALRRTLGELFPILRDVAITHRWGGPLGIARDWHPSVDFDAESGLAWAGGYVGDGVGAANLAGRTLADLLTSRDSALTHLPWVGHRSPKWEPEPLRWLGANAGLQAMTWADNAERRSGKSSRLAGLVNTIMSR